MRLIIKTIVLVTSVTSTGGASAQPITYTELSESVLRESSEYIRIIKSYQCESSLSSVMRGSTEPADLVTHRSRHVGPCQLLVTTQGSGSPPAADRVIGINSKYAFELRRTPGKEWVVSSFHDLATGSAPDVFRAGGVTDAVPKMFSPYWFEGQVWLPTLLRQPKFEVKSIERHMEGMEPRITIKYEYPDPYMKRMIYTGSATLDPGRYWVVLSCDHSGTINNITKRTIRVNQFVTRPDGFPLLSGGRVEVTSTLPKAAGIVREDVLTFSFTPGSADPREITLSAFGLPEPPGVSWKKPTPNYVWFLAAAAGLMVLAILFRRLARRHTAGTTPNPGLSTTP